MAACLRNEVLPFGMHVSLIEPGYFRTNFDERRECFTPEASAYSDRLPPFMARVRTLSRRGRRTERAAEKVWKIATAERPPLMTSIGSGASVVVIAARMVPWRVRDVIVRKFSGVGSTSEIPTVAAQPR
jgi:NAD(P)-dependent dehydrogenase (short-subunit alcohol dehydrogenase family)